ncbi:hypothetical protein CFD26_107503 [Aspergillus turcosus]|uniref:Branched-chain amino acid aminotransferase n=1 Tax=Aspergillus turcosus TaxID=1245748 RepID=A0A421DC31_9EURO|nr:hypothetical protein CFD26_107503 [Aspergillus turcosus]
MMFPKAPSTDIDWSNIGLQGYELTSHVESTYHAETGTWSPPKTVQSPYLQVHGLAPGLNYGQQCFEGLKACRTSDNRLLIFRPQDHARRMAHSAAVASMPAVPEAHFLACVQQAVGANSAYVPPHDSTAVLYIRPMLFGSGAQIGLVPPKTFTFCVYVLPASAYHGESAQKAVVLEDFDRAAPRGVGHAKLGGNYAPVLRWMDQARRDGYGLTLHLDSATHTYIDEFSTSAFLGVREAGGRFTLVVPQSSNIIESVTSNTCATLAKALGWEVEYKELPFEEIQTLSEVMAVGTAALLVPIREIYRPSTKLTVVYQDGGEAPGPACRILRKAIENIMRGRIPDQWQWCVPVVAEAEMDTPMDGGESSSKQAVEVKA